MSDTNRIQEEIDKATEARLRDCIRNQYCALKALTLHSHLSFLNRLHISIASLEQAIRDDWDMREAFYQTSYVRPLSQEELLLHILRNPQILKEPELVFLADLIKLEKCIPPYYQE